MVLVEDASSRGLAAEHLRSRSPRSGEGGLLYRYSQPIHSTIVQSAIVLDCMEFLARIYVCCRLMCRTMQILNHVLLLWILENKRLNHWWATLVAFLPHLCKTCASQEQALCYQNLQNLDKSYVLCLFQGYGGVNIREKHVFIHGQEKSD
jgi:hypothetical protein